ncbi:MAG TPA: DUF5801 repeats-in-toxin domain-containing protein, partial [Bradyrhizobium sp.]|nr:DUF5801 repeats-in-toxin domain-containing protein [Bradyrhizobium sp.]
MNGPFQVAQATGAGNPTNNAPTRIFRLTKPLGDQAVVVNLGYDQKVKVDFSSIANEKITLVHVGDKLIILFDNKSTLTVEPFFDSRHDALNNLSVEVAPGREVSVNEFASLFPITTDQSVLPAAGDGTGNAQGSGANFSTSSVDPLNSGDPLDLLGQEELGNFVTTFDTAALLVNGFPTVSANTQIVFDEDGLAGGNLGGIGDFDPATNGPISATGTLAHSYGSDGAGTTLLLATGAPAGFIYTLSGGGTILTVSQLQNGVNVDVIRITLSNTTDGAFTITQLHAIDHPAGGNENDAAFAFGYRVTDSNGDFVDGTLGLTVDDDSPVAGENAPLVFDEDALPGGNLGGTGDFNTGTNGPITATGTLAHSYGADGAGTVLLVNTGAPEGFTYAVNGTGTVLTVSQLQDGVNVSVLQVVLTDRTSGNYTVTQLHAINHAPGQDENNQSFTFNYNVTDHDGDTTGGTLALTVNDDTPIPLPGNRGEGEGSGSFTFATVYEDGLTNLNSGNQSVGNSEGGFQTTFVVITAADLQSLVSFGADKPGTFSLNPGATAPTLFSHGDPVTYSVVGDTLTASAGGRIVFTLHDNGDQTFTFSLKDQLDHGPLNSGGGDFESLTINLASVFLATDSDNDSIVLNGTFNIRVENDVPVQDFSATVSGSVQEDALTDANSNHHSVGNPEGGGQTTVAEGELSSLVKVGADETGTFSLVLPQSGLPTITSNGGAVLYSVTGDTLTGYVEAGGGGGYQAASDRAVFTLQVTTGGHYKFTLLDQIDHLPNSPANNDSQTLTLNFASAIQFTDFDGDSITLSGGFSITVEDDLPILTTATISRTVDEDDINTAWSQGTSPSDGNGDGSLTEGSTGAAIVTGTLAGLVSVGADEPGKFAFSSDAIAKLTALGLFSKETALGDGENGKPLYYLTSAGGLNEVVITGYEPNPQGNPVFSLTLNTVSGAYEFRLYDELIHAADNGENHDLRSGLPVNGVQATIPYLDLGSIITFTDKDGDSVTLSGKFTVTVTDDVPHADIDLRGGSVTADETPGNQADDTTSSSVRALFAALETSGNVGQDPDVPGDHNGGVAGVGAIAYAHSNFAVVTDDSIIGSDSPPYPHQFTLSVAGGNGTASGLFVTDGNPIILSESNGLIIGTVSGGNFNGKVAFAIAIESDGEVSVAQYLSLRHDDRGDPNETNDNGNNSNDAPPDDPLTVQQTLAGKIIATLTVTDSDGDQSSNSVNIGNLINFLDDGPSVSSNDTVVLEDDDLPGGIDGGPNDDVAPQNASGTLEHNYGADGPGNTLLTGFTLPSGQGFTATVAPDGLSLLIKQNGIDVLKVELTDATSGHYSVTQLHAIDHPTLNGQSGDDTENNVFFTVNYRVTDGDGDFANGTLTVNVDDDSPNPNFVLQAGKLVVIDETAGLQNAAVTPGVPGDANDNDTANPFPVSVTNPGVPGTDSTLFGAPAVAQSVGPVVAVTPNFGADGPGSIVYSIDIPGTSVASGLTTTSGKAITLFEVSSTLVVGRYDANNNGISSTDAAAFAIHIDPTTGVMSVIQYVPIKHDDRGDFDEDNDNGTNANDAPPDDPSTVQQWITNSALRVTATVTDHDGDSVDQRFDIGNAIVFEDDGPSASIVLKANVTLTVDETDGVTANANETDPPGGDLGVAKIAGANLFTETVSYGADGQAASNAKVYSLSLLSAGPTGLTDTATGKPIVLLKTAGGVIEGHADTAAGALVFTISIDAATGETTLTQLRAVVHGNPADPDESTTPAVMNSDLVGITVAVTDGDGDTTTATANLNNFIKFEDDGPTLTGSGTPILANVDEDGLAGHNADASRSGETGPVVASATAIGLAGALNAFVNFGADGPGAVAFHVAAPAAPANSGLHSQGGDVLIVSDGTTLHGYVESGNGIGFAAGDREVFTLTVGADGSYVFTLKDQIDHPTLNGAPSGDDSENLLSAGLDLSAYIVATDGDGDSVTLAAGSFAVQVRDDIPVQTSNTVTGNVDEDELTLANSNNHSVGNPDGDAQTNVATGSLISLVSVGVDEPGSFSLIANPTGLTAVTSKGDAVLYNVSGTVLTGFVDSDGTPGFSGNDRVVFTLDVQPDGSYTFTLKDQIDHIPNVPANDDNQKLILDFTHAIQFTDADGDTIALTGPITTTSVTTGLKLHSGHYDTYTVGGVTFDGLTFTGTTAHSFVNAPGDNAASFNVSGQGIGIGDNLTEDNEGFIFERPGTDAVKFTINGNASGTISWEAYNGGVPVSGNSGFANGSLPVPGDGGLVTIDPPGTFDYLVIRFDLGNGDKIRLENMAFVSTVTTSGGVFTIGVEDDVPVALNGSGTIGTVYEDTLTGLSIGNHEGPASGQPTSITFGASAFTSLVSIGADEDGTFSFNVAKDGTSAGVFSKGLEVKFDVNGDEVDGKTSDGRTVFKLVDNGDGTFTFTLLDQIDHASGSGDSGTIPLNLGSLFRVTDFDGDTVNLSGTLTVSIENDIPVTGSNTLVVVDEDDLAAGNHNTTSPGDDTPSASLTGTLNFSVGADEPATVGFASLNGAAVLDSLGHAVTAGGPAHALHYYWNAATNTLFASTDTTNASTAASSAAFKITVNPSTGAYSFSLLGQVDHPGNDADGANNGPETAYEDNININLTYTVTDRDNDAVTGTLTVSIDDDMPILAPAPVNQLTNGDFGQGTFVPAGFGGVAQPGDVTGWIVSNSTFEPPAPGGLQVERVIDGYLGMHTSTHGNMIDMGASPGNIQISQQLGGLTSGQTYAIEFEAGAPYPATAKLEVLWNNAIIGTIDPAGPMTSYAYVVTATGVPANDQITFREVGAGHAPIPGAADEGYHGTYLANVSVVATAIVDEDGLTGPLSVGNHDSQVGDAVVPNTDGDNNEATATGNLNIQWGADNVDSAVADSTTGLFGTLVQDTPTGAGNRSLTFTDTNVTVAGGMPLTSQGVAVTFSLNADHTVLTGTAGGRTVFEVSLSDDGSGKFRFVLLDQLDHAPNGNENDIALTFNYTATDSDGDAVNGKFIVGVDDDVPVVTGSGSFNIGEVFEDGLVTVNSVGNPEFGSSATFVDFNASSLASFVAVGADDLPTFGLNTAVSGIVKDNAGNAVTSAGFTVRYAASGSDVVGFADANGDGSFTAGEHEVFRLHDNGNGTFRFTLLDQIDHLPLATGAGDAETMSINLATAFKATDFDGDSVVLSGSLTVTVENDIPLATTATASISVREDNLSVVDGDLSIGIADGPTDGPTTVTDEAIFTNAQLQLLVKPGADDPTVFVLTAAPTGVVFTVNSEVVTSHNQTVRLGAGPSGSVVGYVDNDSNGTFTSGDREVFRIIDNHDGTFTFDLKDHLDHNILGTSGAGDAKTLTLDLTNAFGAKDFDGDIAPLGTHAIQVVVENDIPVAGTSTVNLDEDGLSSGNLAGPDDYDAGTNGPITLNANLNVNFGADGAAGTGATAFDLAHITLPGAGGFTVDPSSTAGHILIKQGATNVLEITLTDTSTGAYTVTQLHAIDHPDSTKEDNLQFTIGYTAKDFDGDTATGSFTIDVDDDSPTISATGTVPSITVDETSLATDNTADFGALLTPHYGADGPGSFTYALSVVAGPSGLIDTATGETVDLSGSGSQIFGTTHLSGQTVFVASVDANGIVKLDQQRAVMHADGSDPDDATSLSAANLVTLTATITDHDNDSSSYSIDIGQSLIFKDDGPSIDVTAGVDTGLQLTTHDALTIGPASDTAFSTANFSGLFQIASQSFGADGAGTAPVLSYTLSLVTAGANSHLASQGHDIFLYDVGGVIVGSTALGAPATVTDASVVFSLSVNSSGVVTLTQYQQIDHPIASDPHPTDAPFNDQFAELADGLVNLTASATIVDKDLDSKTDSATIDLGGNIRFADDGPSASATVASTVLDDEAQPLGINGGPDDQVGANVLTTSGDLVATGGGDGFKSFEFSDASLSVTNSAGATSSALSIIYVDPTTHLATTEAITTQWVANASGGGTLYGLTVGGHYSTTAAPAFTLTVDSAGHYVFTANAPLSHPFTDSDFGNNGPETEWEDGLTLNFTYQVTDGDNDTATSTLAISVDDDTPDLGAIQASSIDNDITSVTGSIAFSPGADGVGLSSLLGNVPPSGVTVDGQPIHYWVSTDGGTLIAYTGAVIPNGGSEPPAASQVFTLTVNPDGQSYTFDLQQPLDGAVTQPLLANGSSFGSGPANYQILTTGPGAAGTALAVASGWDGTALETAASFAAWQAGNPSATYITHTSINGSTGGWGVADNNFTTPDFMRFDFGTITDIDGAGGSYAPPAGPVLAPTSVAFDFPHAAAGDKIAYVVHFSDGSFASVAEVADPTADLVITAPSGLTIDNVEFFASDIGGAFKVDLESASITTGSNVNALSFAVKLTDGDGDAEQGAINVTVTDHVPTVTVPGVGAAGTVVDEKGLPDGTGELANAAPNSDNSETTSGSFSYTPGDGATTIKIDGVAVTVGGIFHGDYGDLTVTAITATTVSYTYTLNGNTLDHDNTTASPEPGDRGTQDQLFDQFAITVSDAGGDTAAANLTIAVNDDGPTAAVEPPQTLVEGTTLTGGHFDFVAGADGGSVTHINNVALTFGPDGFSQPIVTAHGVLTVKADGTYTFTAQADDFYLTGGPVTGTYTVTDGDGDTATAGFSFTVTDDADVTKVTLNDVTVNEGVGTATISASVDHAPQGSDLHLTLSNGATITILAGQTTGTSTPFAVQDDDPYIDHETYTVSITGSTGGNYEALDKTDTATVTVNDTINVNHVTLDDVVVFENQTFSYTAQMNYAATEDVVVTLSNGVTITFAPGHLTASSAPQAAQGDDVYVDGQVLPVSISSVSGGNFEAVDKTDTATVTINDTIDPTTVSLSTSDVQENVANVTFTATLSSASHGTTTVHTDHGDISITNGNTTGTLLVPTGNSEDVYIDPSSVTATILSASGGNFEQLDIGTASATAHVTDTINPTTVSLSTSDVQENVANVTFTATLSNASEGDTTVVTDLGTIVIGDGQTTGT